MSNIPAPATPRRVAKRRLVLWLLTATIGATGLLMLVPGSPAYLPALLYAGGVYEGKSVSHWVKQLDSSDEHSRFQAIFALGAIGAEADAGVPALAAILQQDADPDARNQAALALSKMAPASRGAINALAAALSDQELGVRMSAAVALLRLGAEARPAVAALTRAVHDESNQTNLGRFHCTIQEVVAVSLGRASAGNGEGVATLITLVEGDVTDELRAAAVRGLGEVGSEARTAVPLLTRLLADNSPIVRESAEGALWKIGAPADQGHRHVSDATRMELPESEREYLWKIENRGNELVKYGFAPLGQAIATGDLRQLAALLAPDFKGTAICRPRTIKVNTGHAVVDRLTEGGLPPYQLNRDGFASRLLNLRRRFGGNVPKVQISLKTLSPRVREQIDGEWEGAAQVRIYGVGPGGAPVEVVAQLSYRLAKLSRDVLTRPGWFTAGGLGAVSTATAPEALFVEVAQKRGLDTRRLHDNWSADKFTPVTGGIYVTDYNRDGVLDLLVTDVNGSSLYEGRLNGSFQDVTTRLGLPSGTMTGGGVAWIDIDGDGWEDLVYGEQVFRNEEGKRFANYTRRSNLRVPSDASGLLIADYDRDGKLDIYVTRPARPGGKSWLDPRSADPKGNRLYRNKGDWQFEDVTRASGTTGGRRSSFTAAWLDANNDGWPDLHVINEFGDGQLLINNGNGTFRRRALADQPADFGSMGLAVGDIDNDGNIDLYCANMFSKAGTRVIGNLKPDAYPPETLRQMRRFVAGSQLHLNRGGLKFDQVGPQREVAAVGWAYGACLADLDNDGWLDIYATAGYISRSRTEPDG